MRARAWAILNRDIFVSPRNSALLLSGTVTLHGSGVYIFQIASGLTVGTGASVVLSGGATAANIFWQVGSSATLGTTADFKGTILALTSISLATGAKLEGRALAQHWRGYTGHQRCYDPACRRCAGIRASSSNTTKRLTRFSSACRQLQWPRFLAGRKCRRAIDGALSALDERKTAASPSTGSPPPFGTRLTQDFHPENGTV